ncbi:MAG: PH domain-containing protein [Bacteroidales bacterium]|nr:PH domain-containing protein [Bacteroidales bacterium]
MENLHFNLSEEESSKGWKVLLGIFAGIFLLTGVYIIVNNLVFNRGNIPLTFSVVPIAIGILVASITIYVAVRRKEQYFNITDSEIEFRYGIMKARYHKFRWEDVREIMLPRGQKKARLHFRDGSDFIINLTWLDRQKAARIRKYILYVAREKDFPVHKVISLRKGK